MFHFIILVPYIEPLFSLSINMCTLPEAVGGNECHFVTSYFHRTGVIALSLEDTDLYGVTQKMRVDEKVDHIKVQDC